jgi:carbonic anhydrase
MCYVGLSTYSRKKNKSKENKKKIEIDSVQWKKEHYVINRDSAYADPRRA